MKQLLLFGLIFLLAACGTPELSTPAPTPEAIHVNYPAALKPWADQLARCATDHPLTGLYFNQYSKLETDIRENDIELVFGEPPQGLPPYSLTQIGWEQVVVITNIENETSQLSIGELQSIFSGQTSGWQNDSGELIQVWVLPLGDPTRTFFDRAVIPSQSLASEAMLAPDPAAMLEAISDESNTIGYLPHSILDSGDPTLVSAVNIIQLDDTLDEALRQPVIAITRSEPTGLMRELLVCLSAPTP